MLEHDYLIQTSNMQFMNDNKVNAMFLLKSTI